MMTAAMQNRPSSVRRRALMPRCVRLGLGERKIESCTAVSLPVAESESCELARPYGWGSPTVSVVEDTMTTDEQLRWLSDLLLG